MLIALWINIKKRISKIIKELRLDILDNIVYVYLEWHR
jgi:hypothetical protein